VKTTYNLNPETLVYEKTGKEKSFSVKNLLWILFSGIGFGFVLIILVANFYPSPQERKLSNELAILEKNYKELNKKLEQSIIIYEQLLDKEKEIQKLTFDAEIEQLQSITNEMSMYSAEFDFSKQLQSTGEKIRFAALESVNLRDKLSLLLDIAYARKKFLQSIPAILPVEKGEFVLVSGPGMRIHPIFKTLRQHNGIDLAARQGTPVVATGSGVVIRPPRNLEGLGNVVAIDHGFGYVSVYACLLKSEVKPGNKVERGQIIGSVGRSGIASGPHLHYEVHKKGQPVNPVNYFFLSVTPQEFADYMEKASIQNQNMS
jgi:murein DD-endopeptidase MepM/ murein hydrolase activator NlpD